MNKDVLKIKIMKMKVVGNEKTNKTQYYQPGGLQLTGLAPKYSLLLTSLLANLGTKDPFSMEYASVNIQITQGQNLTIVVVNAVHYKYKTLLFTGTNASTILTESISDCIK